MVEARDNVKRALQLFIASFREPALRRQFCQSMNEARSQAWLELESQDVKFQRLVKKRAYLERCKSRYTDNLIKVTSKLLSSVGKDGVVLFPTNLLDQRKRGRTRDSFDHGQLNEVWEITEAVAVRLQREWCELV